MQTAQTKQKPKRRFLAKRCLDFMTHILPVEWIFASAKRARVSLLFEIFVVADGKMGWMGWYRPGGLVQLVQ
jgi:hypothetical protein